MPGRSISTVANSPDKVQLARVSHVYLVHPDLSKCHAFSQAFGFVEAAREDNTIYYRGFGQDPCVYVATQSTTGEKDFFGGAFLAKTEDDFVKVTKLEGASIPKASQAPGGGQIVTVSSPSGSKIHVLWGVEERPPPEKAVTPTHIKKGAYNTSLAKFRKGMLHCYAVSNLTL